MSTMLDDAKAAAIKLSPTERSELIHFLEDISAEEMKSIRSSWEAESLRRFAELESGTVTGVPLEQVFGHRKSM